MRNLFICFLSGIATSLGFVFCYLKIKKETLITFTLAFAASIMFFVSTSELIPEGIFIINNQYLKPISFLIITIFLGFGILIAFSLDKIIKSKEDNLYRIGVYTAIGLIIHNVLEGVVTYLTLTIDTVIGIKLAISIALHNIPEGISIAIPLFYSKSGRVKLFKYLIFLSLSEIFGAFLAFLFFQNINFNVIGELYLVIAGIMMYIAIFELGKESLNYKKSKIVLSGLALGFILIKILKIL